MGSISESIRILCGGRMPPYVSRSMLVAHTLLISKLIQNLGSLALSFMVSIPMTSLKVSAIYNAWSWCSWGNFLKLTQVGNAKLLRLSGLNPRTQLWIMQAPHLDMNGDNINALFNASLSSPLKRKNHFPTFLQKVNALPLNSWFRAWIHNLIACGGGFDPTNFPIKS